MTRFSKLVWIAAFAVACGGGKKKQDTTPPAGGGADTTAGDTTTPPADTTPAVAQKKEPEPPAPPRKTMTMKLPTELEWKPLDEKAGDKGPMVASLWGDMGASENGFFIKVPKGDKGTLHTHTSDYHAVAISGTPSNPNDGTKKAAPLPAMSYWFQPGGVAHTTSCDKKAECIGYVHVMGKFDFAPAKPVKGAKHDPRHVEKRAKDLKWAPLDPAMPKGPQVAQLWGDGASTANGFMLKLPAGGEPFWHIHKADYHGVVLQGTVTNMESGTEGKEMPVGSYWMQPGGNKHTTNCKAGKDCIVYLEFTGAFDVVPAK